MTNKSHDKNQMTGAAMIVRALIDHGVEHIFGYPGGAVLPIYDEIFQQSEVEHILVRHEQGAGHAAEGYARSTGKVGVVLATSGPGATNCVTGLTDALLDSIPMVCLTGQVPTHLIGNDAFQECDTVGITRPIAPAAALTSRSISACWPVVMYSQTSSDIAAEYQRASLSGLSTGGGPSRSRSSVGSTRRLRPAPGRAPPWASVMCAAWPGRSLL